MASVNSHSSLDFSNPNQTSALLPFDSLEYRSRRRAGITEQPYTADAPGSSSVQSLLVFKTPILVPKSSSASGKVRGEWRRFH